MYLGKAINMVPAGETRTLCIISLRHVIIAKVSKSSETPSHTSNAESVNIVHEIAHTEPLPLFTDDPECEKSSLSLILTLSALAGERREISAVVPASPDAPILPYELVEMIFHDLTMTSGNSLVNFCLTCKQFAAIVRHNTLRVSPDWTILTFHCPAPDGEKKGNGGKSKLEMAPTFWVVDHKSGETREMRGTEERWKPWLKNDGMIQPLVDGVDVGFGGYTMKRCVAQPESAGQNDDDSDEWE
jgi:hypothetical protein